MLYKKTKILEGIYFRFNTKLKYQFYELPKSLRNIWIEKYHEKYCKLYINEKDIEYIYNKHAYYVAEYSEILNIVIGALEQKDGIISKDTILLNGKFEKDILQDFVDILDKVPNMVLGGFNIVNYGIPFIIKRMLFNKIKLPFQLNIKDKKPWEINVIDVMKDYQGNMFGDIDLDLLALNFGIEISNSITEEMEALLSIIINLSF